MTDNSAPLSIDLSWNRRALLGSLAVILFCLPALWLLYRGYTVPAALYVALPIAFLALMTPRYAFYFMLFSNFVYAPYLLGGVALHPGDLAALLFLTAVLIGRLLEAPAAMAKTRFDYYFWALILVAAVSAVFARDPLLSLVPIMRLFFIYFVFRAIYTYSRQSGPRRCLTVYIYGLALISLFHTALFLHEGGTDRIFGFSGIGFETFIMTVVPVTLAFAIWSSSAARRRLFTVLFIVNLLGALATMSRGPLLTIALACPVLLIVSYRKARQMKAESAIKYMRILAAVIIPTIIIAAVVSGFFFQVWSRFSELGTEQPSGTILLRMSLWRAALDSFALNPLTGIGIGNFKIIDDLLPHLKFDPVRFYLVGMSFHNVFLHFLAETGLIGAGVIGLFGLASFRTGLATVKKTMSPEAMPASAAVFVLSFIFLITLFYMRVWTWGQEGFVLAFILALLARQYQLVEENKG